MKTYVVTPHENRLGETVLMIGHNVCFKEIIWNIISKLSLYPFLSGALIITGTLTRCLESLEKVERENPATTQALKQVIPAIHISDFAVYTVP